MDGSHFVDSFSSDDQLEEPNDYGPTGIDSSSLTSRGIFGQRDTKYVKIGNWDNGQKGHSKAECIWSKIFESLNRVLDVGWHTHILIWAFDVIEDWETNEIVSETPQSFQTNDFDGIKIVTTQEFFFHNKLNTCEKLGTNDKNNTSTSCGIFFLSRLWWSIKGSNSYDANTNNDND